MFGNRMLKNRQLIFLAATMSIALAAQAQSQGPITPAPKREVKRIPMEGAVEPPPVAAEEIVRRFSEKETELARLRNSASFQVSVRLVEFDERGEQSGEFQMITAASVAPDGRPIEKILRATKPNLKFLDLPQEDLEDLTRIPPFLFPAAQLEHYDLTYTGKQPVDELTTYVFSVKPKRLERRHKFFEGLIWVDDQDFAIVKTYGRFVSEIVEDAQRQPFQFFETYRQLVDGKHWMPAYTRSDDAVRTKQGEARLRLTIRYEDYRLPAVPPPQP
jgi:hypothetical protein